DRLLAYVYITPSDMYNIDVVKKGFARVAYVIPPNTDHLGELKAAQSYAKSHNLGIWSTDGYVTSSGYNISYACKWAPKHGYSARGCSSQQGEFDAKASTSASSSGSSGGDDDGGLKYDPNGPDRDCGDFDTQQQAQKFMEATGPDDPDRLDGYDNDGRACESLP
ncbi:MAG TPA: thermonuclease family protein, partial [Bacillales bacterium]|nr:thermonuclease family protein [Bacillales bacterium]